MKNKIKLAFLLPLTFLASCKEQSTSGTSAPIDPSPAHLSPTDPSPTKPSPSPDTHQNIVGPFAHKNLAIYLIKGPNPSTNIKWATLSEAMDQKLVTVHETGNVSELKIENKSPDTHIFIHSGDIVKGGKQDRTLPNSIVLSPKSAPTPIASFCVEQSRWAQRGNEELSAFSSSSKSLNSKELKIAARKSKNQSEVWEKVAKAQGKISANLGKSVQSEVSATSLQLTLEDKDLEKLSNEYIDSISSQISLTENLVGYAFAINGEFNSSDLYFSPDLFSKVWPRRLEAAANEAIAELDSKNTSPHPKPNAIAIEVTPTIDPQAITENLPGGNTLVFSESKNAFTFDAHLNISADNHLVHRNTISKP